MIKKITAGFLLASASFLANAGSMSNLELKQKFYAESQRCMSIQKPTLKQECFAEFRSNMSQSLRERQRKVGEEIAGREDFKEAVKNREEIYDEAKHKNPEW
jgi:hypothetical protein